MPINQKEFNPTDNSSPPIFGSWKKIYFTVCAFLVFNILFFYFFTKVFD
ncbi:MAG TPA: hypothetical protein VI362_07480 [Ignavibacteriaceae bacterium]|nr:hypothetical protein [Ignavibacteriaceae bacterium]